MQIYIIKFYFQEVQNINDLKPIIAKNISELRKANDITQADLAEKLNYSDKAVSKWERGESIPDINVLKNIADIFGVGVDYLITEEKVPANELVENDIKQIKNNRIIITAMTIFLVLLISTFVYVVMEMATGFKAWHLLTFLYTLPICSIIMIVFNTVWFNTRYNFAYISALMWSLLTALIVTFLVCGVNILLLLVVGIPGQIIIIMWSQLKFKSKEMVIKFKNKRETKSEEENKE